MATAIRSSIDSLLKKDGSVHPQPILPYAQRSIVLEWRANLFRLTRGENVAALTLARDHAIATKLRNIERRGQKTGHKAGYDPAGAGSPWYSIGPRNINGRVKSLAVHPTDPNTCYAGSVAGGVWQTTDGGQTWNPLWDMQTSLAIGAIAVAPSNPKIVYAGTGERTPGYSLTYDGAGVFVSTDGGQNWSQQQAVKSRRISRLLVHPTNPQKIWVCGDAGFETSADGGATWTTLRTDTVSDAALDPFNPSIVYIAVAYNGFYKSTDSGSTFTILPGSPTGTTVASFPQIAIGKNGAHSNNFIAVSIDNNGIQTSTDGGTTFVATTTSPGLTSVGWSDVIAVAPDNESILIWGGTNLNISTNGGANWAVLGVHADQHAAVFAPSDTNVIYFANDGGVWRSDDKGATVNKVSNGLVITQFYNINFWSPYSNVLGGGAQDTGVSLTTGGLSWTQIYGGDGGWILVDPTDPHIIYTESQWGNIEKSVDGGTTWTPKTSGIAPNTSPWLQVLTMDPKDHLRIFYGTNTVYRSTDGLATAWIPVSQALDGTITVITIDPTNSSNIFVGTNGPKLYKSTDGGNSQPWADITGTIASRTISGINVNGNIVMVSLGGIANAAGSQTVFRSTDGGTTWTDVSGDLPNVCGNGIVVDPSNSNIWYLATDTGVFRTTNGGSTWDAFDNGIPNVPITGFVVDPRLNMLYCSTFGRGAYKLDITPGVTKAQVDLYVRDDDIDTGEQFSSPSGVDDPFIPLPGTANFWMSPDIKVNHAPVYVPTGVFDGVDFDQTLVHQDPYLGQSNRFYVQVTNRGWQPTNNVWIRAFIAEAAAGLPNLPNALVPPNFDVASGGLWTPVGASQSISQLVPDRPGVVYWDFVIPPTESTHSCCLLVVSSDENQFKDSTTDIATLIQNNKQVALKNLHLVDPGPGGMPPKLQGINFNNPSGTKQLIEIILRPIGFSSGRIGLLFPKITITDPDKQTKGVTLTRLPPDDPIGTWYNRGGSTKTDELLRKRFLACDRSHIFEFDTNRVSQLYGIELEAGEALKAVLVSTLKNSVYVDGPSRIEILQTINGKVIGGAIFQYGYDLPPPGPPCRRIRITADSIEWCRCEKKPCHHHEHCVLMFLLARATVKNGFDRTSEKLLASNNHGAHSHNPHHDDKQTIKNVILFDGVVSEGESLSLAISAIDGKDFKESTLFERDFDADLGIRSWLGEYEGTGKSKLSLKYGIDEITENSAGGGDD